MRGGGNMVKREQHAIFSTRVQSAFVAKFRSEKLAFSRT